MRRRRRPLLTPSHSPSLRVAVVVAIALLLSLFLCFINPGLDGFNLEFAIMPSALLVTFAQSTVLNAISNVLAQLIDQRKDTVSRDWTLFLPLPPSSLEELCRHEDAQRNFIISLLQTTT